MRHERPLDLHALSTPPAFILDQDQILIKNKEKKIARNNEEKVDPIFNFFKELVRLTILDKKPVINNEFISWERFVINHWFLTQGFLLFLMLST